MKKILLDTSILVAAMVTSHPEHAIAFKYLRDARQNKFHGIIAAHSLAEVYAVLSSMPVQPRISPDAAWQLIKKNLIGTFEIVSLSKSDYISVIQKVSGDQLSGGIIYDALIAQSAIKAGADQLITLNVADFKRVASEKLMQTITSP
ncbi:MAG: PIN domain-containing protein [Nitrospirae bacterium]|nr:PIN domain-containing protein [Nitrospirota bacterium]